MRKYPVVVGTKAIAILSVMKVGSSYRITIPKQIAEHMGICEKDSLKLEYCFQNREIKIRKNK